MHSYLVVNSRYLKILSGTDIEIGTNPILIQATSEGIMDAIEKNSIKIASLSEWQFKLLI